MKKKSTASVYFKVFVVSTIAGFSTFFLITFFFERVLSKQLLLYSALLGPVIGNMIGFSCTLIGDRISRRLESLPRPFSAISQALTYFVVALAAATVFFFFMVKLGMMSVLPTKLLLTLLLITAGIGVAVTFVMTVYEHLKTELEKSYEKLREKELLEKELQVARQVQVGFLPSGDIRIDGFDVTTFFRPAKEVGGDYFDIIPMKKGIGITIADVSGNGVPASLVMANLHATLHALAEDCSLVELLNRINRSIFKNTPPDVFVTFFYGVLNNSTGKLQYVNAGHNPPLVVRQEGTVEELTQRGVGMGILLDTSFHTGSITIHPLETMLLYTDGLIEAGLPQIEPWGEENLKSYLSTIYRESTDHMAELIFKKIEEPLKGVPQTDDIALVLLKRSESVG